MIALLSQADLGAKVDRFKLAQSSQPLQLRREL